MIIHFYPFHPSFTPWLLQMLFVYGTHCGKSPSTVPCIYPYGSCIHSKRKVSNLKWISFAKSADGQGFFQFPNLLVSLPADFVIITSQQKNAFNAIKCYWSYTRFFLWYNFKRTFPNSDIYLLELEMKIPTKFQVLCSLKITKFAWGHPLLDPSKAAFLL